MFFMISDYIENGMDKHCEHIVASESERSAVSTLLHYLERCGKCVQCITAVYGVSTMEQLQEVSDNGPTAGMSCVAYS